MANDRALLDWGRGLHIGHLNVCSMFGNHRLDLLKIQVVDSGLDVFSISETWLTEAIPDELMRVEGYNIARLDRSWGGDNGGNLKKGGGLACYIKQGHKFSDRKHEDLNISSKDLEAQWLEIDLPNVRPIVIINIYRPPQGDYKKCCSLMVDMFNRAKLKDNTDVFLLGDFNINLNEKGSPEAKELMFTTGALGLKQLIQEPARISFRQGIVTKTKIDLIFSNSDFIKSVGVLDWNMSDHLAVRVTRKKVQAKIDKVEFKGRSYRNYDKERFQRKLLDSNWEEFDAVEDPNRLWELMENKILEVIEGMCPIKKFRVTEGREPWLTNEALEAIKDKDRILRRAKRSGKEADWVEAKRVRNRVGRDLELLRADFLKQQQEEFKSDPKKFWRVIASVIPGKKGGKSNIWLKDQGSGEEVPPEGVPEFINSFFTGIGPELAKQHKTPWEYFGDENPIEIQDIITNQEEVLRLCKEINTMKSSGFDKLSAKICKDAFTVLTNKLVKIFNCSLRSSIFPTAWKSAKVVPLFKGGERETVGNYGPVSLLPLPGKLLEKVVHQRISQFWETHNILSGDQGGFRKGFCTSATIADLTDDFMGQINQGMTTLAVFIDLKKAFDTVNLSILTRKLYKSGIRGETLRWCGNYLNGRKQCTTANGITSSFLPITCGVPQGSVLGPLFFLIYVNDLKGALNDCKVKLYADDTVLYQSGVNCQQAEDRLQTSMNSFQRWCAANALTINAKKTKIMAFGSRSKVKKCDRAKITLNGVKLKLVPSYKYLGMVLDSTLNYTNHISATIRTVQHKLAILGKVKRYLHNDVALKIYKTMLLPYLDYADVIFSKAKSTELDKLQRLQNRSLRLCLGHNRYFSTDLAHKNSGVPS